LGTHVFRLVVDAQMFALPLKLAQTSDVDLYKFNSNP